MQAEHGALVGGCHRGVTCSYPGGCSYPGEGGGRQLPGGQAVTGGVASSAPRSGGTHQLEAERPEAVGERRAGAAGRCRWCRRYRRCGGGLGPQPPQQPGGRPPSHLAGQLPQVGGQRLPAALHAGGAAAAALSPRPEPPATPRPSHAPGHAPRPRPPSAPPPARRWEGAGGAVAHQRGPPRERRAALGGGGRS